MRHLYRLVCELYNQELASTSDAEALALLNYFWNLRTTISLDVLCLTGSDPCSSVPGFEFTVINQLLS
jgi:hypothetical protein